MLREGFKSFKRHLNSSFFAEPHYSFIVNMNYIKRFKRTEIFMDVHGKEKKIGVSSDKQAPFKKAYIRFLGEDYL